MRKSKYSSLDLSSLPNSAEKAIEQGIRLFTGGAICKEGHTKNIKIISSLNPLKWGCYECRKVRDRAKKQELRLSEDYRETNTENAQLINKVRYWSDNEYRHNLLQASKERRVNTKCASYGITKAQYDDMFSKQNGACAICHSPESSTHGNGSIRSLHIDHCHTTGEVRGLLCSDCNRALGGFKDSVVILSNAISYLSSQEHEKEFEQVELPFDLVLPINKKMWEPLNTKQLAFFVDKLFTHYRATGFPYHIKPTKESLNDDILNARIYLQNYPIVVDNEIRQTMHLLGTAWSFFPHAYSVVCNRNKTPLDIFNDDTLFRHALNKRLKIGTYVSDGGVRKILMSISGVQSVSNFRPTAAAGVISRYIGNGSVILDPCAGWGGRLLGAELSNVRYIGLDPSIKTFHGLVELNTMLGNKHSILNVCAEEYVHSEPVDLVFTSPPYFNCEQYAEEETQSWIRYKTSHEWFNGFLVPMIRNAMTSLVVGGKVVLNIADVKTYPNLTRDLMVWVTEQLDLVFIEELKLILSKGFKSGHKYEPVFIFEKTSLHCSKIHARITQ